MGKHQCFRREFDGDRRKSKGMELKYPIYLRLSLITTLLLSAALTGTRAQAVEFERSEDLAGSPAADLGRPRLLNDPSLAGSALHLNSGVVVSDLSAPAAPQAAPTQSQARPAKKDTFSALEPESSQAALEAVPAQGGGEAPMHFSFSGGQAPGASTSSSEDTFHFVDTAPSAANSVAPPAAPSINFPFVSMTDPHVAEERPQPSSPEDAPFSFRAPASVTPMTAPLASNEPVAVPQPENAGETPYRFR